MELLTPQFGLLAWTFIGACNIILAIYAFIRLSKNKSIDPTLKLFWLLVILFLPFIGSIIFLQSFNKRWPDTKTSTN